MINSYSSTVSFVRHPKAQRFTCFFVEGGNKREGAPAPPSYLGHVSAVLDSGVYYTPKHAGRVGGGGRYPTLAPKYGVCTSVIFAPILA